MVSHSLVLIKGHGEKDMTSGIWQEGNGRSVRWADAAAMLYRIDDLYII